MYLDPEIELNIELAFNKTTFARKNPHCFLKDDVLMYSANNIDEFTGVRNDKNVIHYIYIRYQN